ncbi:Mtc1 family protein OS=Streptomyces alboniger OX=132473 GN=CP975_09550 PE=4 SV=1 [Streptomyces alboniger]
MAAWTWRFEKADGTEVQPAVQPEEFTTQGDAESWVGEYWKALSDGGADQATLFEDTTKIYGPMSLHADAAEASEEAQA